MRSLRGGSCAFLLALLVPGMASGAITRVGLNWSTTGTSPLSLPIGTVTAGTLIVVVVQWDSTSVPPASVTISDSRGNTWSSVASVTNSSSGNVGQKIFYAPNAIGGSDTVTVSTPVGATMAASANMWSGAATSDPVDVFSTAAGTVSTTNATTSLTTTGSGELIIAGIAYRQSSPISAGAGYTSDSGSSASLTFRTEHRTAATPNTYVANGTLGTSNSGWVVSAVAFKQLSTATKLSFTSLPVNTSAGACSAALTVQLQDSANTPVNGAPTPVNLSTTSGGGRFYAASDCSGTSITATSIPSSGSTVTLYYSDTVAGSPQLTASSAGLTSGVQTGTVTAGPASRLGFTTGARTFSAGACGGAGQAITVALQDGFGNPVNAGAGGRSFTAASTSAGTVSWFTDSGCSAGAPGGTFTLPDGSSSVSLFYVDTRAGNPTVTLSNGSGLANPAGQQHTVAAGAPTQLGFTSPARTFTAGTCSGAGNVITVQLQDAFGNAVDASAGGQTFTAASSSAGTTGWYTDATCSAAAGSGAFTIAAGSSTVSLFYQDTQAGTPQLSLTNGSGLANPAPQGSVVNPAAPSRLVFTSAPQTLSPGQCSPSPAVVQVQDASGNSTSAGSPRTVSLAADSGTMTFYSDAACTSPVGSVGVGAGSTTSSFYFRDTVSGSVQVTASTAGLAVGQQTQTVQVGAVAQLAFASAPKTVMVGVCSTAVVVESRDGYGNPAPVVGSTSVTLASSSPANAFFTDPGCGTPLVAPSISAGTSTLTFYFRDTRSGAPTLSATSMPLSQGTQPQTVNPGPAIGLQMSGVPANVAADQMMNVTVTAVDGYGNPAPGYTGTITFSSSSPSATLPGPFTFNGTQTSASFIVGLGTSGTQSMTVTDGTMSDSEAGIQVEPGSPARFVLSGVSSPRLVGDVSSLTIEVLDGPGNRVTTYQGRVHITSSDPGAALPPDYTFNASEGGVHSYPAQVRLMTPGMQNLSATDMAAPTLSGTLGPLAVHQLPGGSCGASTDCASSFCANGVCCQTACSGTCMACNLPGSMGTCAVVPNGTSCQDSMFCNGAETCQAGACQPGAPVSCVDAFGHDILWCQESTRDCEIVPNSPPSIAHDANLTAGVGNAYVYNAQGAMRAAGARPMTFSPCGGPAELKVEATTGTVRWTPAAAGAVNVCLRAENAAGADTYNFTVQVGVPGGADPVADFAATPVEGRVPLNVAFDASASTGTPSLVLYGWALSRGGPPASGVTQSFTYPVPGTYRPTLTVTDAFGRQASATRTVTVLGAAGQRPPVATITAPRLQADRSLEVDLGCNCQAGDAPIVAYRWELGGISEFGPTVHTTFAPGRYRVYLTVTDAAGLMATDSVEVVVTEDGRAPPYCRAWALPPFATAPADLLFTAQVDDGVGTVVSESWTHWDGSQVEGTELRSSVTAPGRYSVVLRVVNDAGLPCVDSAEAVVFDGSGAVPPRIEIARDEARDLQCDEPNEGTDFLPAASGDGPLVWSLEDAAGGPAPEGIWVDPQTGQLGWSPRGGPAEQSVVLRVSGPGGADSVPLSLQMHCSRLALQVGCGCGAGTSGSTGLLALALAALWRERSRRRASDKGVCSRTRS